MQSGNIGVADLAEGAWIIDETVDSIDAASAEIVRDDDRYAAYRPALEDAERRERYAELRRKFFLPVRPLEHYLSAFERAGFRVLDVEHRIIDAERQHWIDFLSVYHEGVLGWVGGSERIEDVPPSAAAVTDRLELLRLAVDEVFAAPTFDAVWTYVDAF